MILCFCSVITD